MNKTGIILGVVFCGLSVIIGAFGAHYLELRDKYIAIYDKAVLYQMFHALAILLVSILNQMLIDINLDLSIWLFVVGILLFSGSLYILAITEIDKFGAITPIGGTLFIAGWIVLLNKIISLNN